MSPGDFCYWLKGFFEVHMAGGGDAPALTAEQSRAVLEHLRLVFDARTDSGKALEDFLERTRTPWEAPTPAHPPGSTPDVPWMERAAPYRVICGQGQDGPVSLWPGPSCRSHASC